MQRGTDALLGTLNVNLYVRPCGRLQSGEKISQGGEGKLATQCVAFCIGLGDNGLGIKVRQNMGLWLDYGTYCLHPYPTP